MNRTAVKAFPGGILACLFIILAGCGRPKDHAEPNNDPLDAGPGAIIRHAAALTGVALVRIDPAGFMGHVCLNSIGCTVNNQNAPFDLAAGTYPLSTPYSWRDGPVDTSLGNVIVASNGDVSLDGVAGTHLDVINICEAGDPSPCKTLRARTASVTYQPDGYQGHFQIWGVWSGWGVNPATIVLIKNRRYHLSVPYTAPPNSLPDERHLVSTAPDLFVDSSGEVSGVPGTAADSSFLLIGNSEIKAKIQQVTYDAALYQGHFIVYGATDSLTGNGTVRLIKNRRYQLSLPHTAPYTVVPNDNQFVSPGVDLKVNHDGVLSAETPQAEASFAISGTTISARTESLQYRAAADASDGLYYQGFFYVYGATNYISGNATYQPFYLIKNRSYRLSAPSTGLYAENVAEAHLISSSVDLKVDTNGDLLPYAPDGLVTKTYQIGGKTVTALTSTITYNAQGYPGPFFVGLGSPDPSTGKIKLLKNRRFALGLPNSAPDTFTTSTNYLVSETPDLRVSGVDGTMELLTTPATQGFTISPTGTTISAQAVPVNYHSQSHVGTFALLGVVSPVTSAQFWLVKSRRYVMTLPSTYPIANGNPGDGSWVSAMPDLRVTGAGAIAAVDGSNVLSSFDLLGSDITARVGLMTVSRNGYIGDVGLYGGLATAPPTGNLLARVVKGRKYYIQSPQTGIDVSASGACTPTSYVAGGSTLTVSCGDVPAGADVEPLLTCVVSRGSQYTAVFGYQNAKSTNVYVAPTATENVVTPTPNDRGQPRWFKGYTAAEPTQPVAFSVDLAPGASVTWKVGLQSVTATGAPSGTCQYIPDGPDGPAVRIGTNDYTIVLDNNKIASHAVVATEVANGPTGEAAGGVTGDLSVTNDGAAFYQIPISVPPGRAGMQPNLALSYSSRAGNGLVGVGWSITPLPEISVCPKTIRQDGSVLAAVQFSGAGPFCYEGQRLIQVAGATFVHADGREFRTERDNGMRFISHDVGGIPVWWEVWDKGGRFSRFGVHPRYPFPTQRLGQAKQYYAVSVVPPGPETQPWVRFAWPITEVADRSGNTMTVTYEVFAADSRNPTTGIFDFSHEQYPSQITYAGKDGQGGQRNVSFEYESSRAGPLDDVSRFYRGVNMVIRKRLSRIVTTAPRTLANGTALANAVVNYYQIEYDTSPISGRSLVKAVRRCDPGVDLARGGGDDVCLAPVTFQWDKGDQEQGSGAPAFRSIATNIDDVLPTNFEHGPAMIMPGDINGDGRDDIVYAKHPGNRASDYDMNANYVYRLANTTEETPFAGSQSTVGNPDLALGTTASQGGILVDATGSGRVKGYNFQAPNRDVRLIDFDGDRKLELFWGEGSQADPLESSQMLWSYKTFAMDPVPEIGGTTYTDFFSGYNFVVVDTDNNGAGDVLADQSHEWSTISNWGILIPKAAGSVGTTDVNGDGLTDLLKGAGDQASPAGVYVNTGFGFMFTGPLNQSFGTNIRTLDYNSDGRLDTYDSETGVVVLSRYPGGGTVAAPPAMPTGHFASGWTTWGRDFDSCKQRDPQLLPCHCKPGAVGCMDGVHCLPHLCVQNAAICQDNYQIDVNPEPYNNATFGVFCPENNATRGCIGFPPDPNEDVRCTCSAATQLWSGGTCRRPEKLPLLKQYRVTQTLDWNGDGLTDLVTVDPTTRRLVLHLRNGKKPDMLTRVTDGLGAYAKVEYDPISNGAVYAPGSGCEHPFVCLTKGMWVVSAVERDSGVVGAPARVAYSYEDGRSDLLGRGFLGFLKRTETRHVTPTMTREERFLEITRQYAERTFELDNHGNFPYRGIITKTEYSREETRLFQMRGHRTIVTLALLRGVAGTTESNPRIFRVSSLTTTTAEYVNKSYPWSGAEVMRQTTRTVPRDIYGNATSEMVEIVWRPAPGVSSKVARTQTVYAFQEGSEDTFLLDRYLGLFDNIITTGSYDGTVSDQKTIHRTYDVQRGLLEFEEIQKNGGADLALNVDYEYNDDGLRTKTTTISPGSGESRAVSLRYDPTERMFPEVETNAAGHEVRNVFEPGLAVVAWSKEPNGRIVRFTYDGFGRLRSTQGGRQAGSTLSYTAEPGRPLVVTTMQNTGDKQRVGLDRLGRQVVQGTRIDGAWVENVTTYNDLGWPIRVTQPYGETRLAYDDFGREYARGGPDDTGAYFWTYTEFLNYFETLTTDRAGRKHRAFADGLGQIVKRQDEWAEVRDPTTNELIQAAGQQATEYLYLPFGLLDKVVTPDGTVADMTYDPRGRRTQVTTLESGLTTSSYNAFGDVRREEDAGGRVTTFAMDPLGRVKERRDERSGLVTSVSTFTFDSAPNGIGSVYTATRGAPDDVTTSFAYDQDFGNLQSTEQKIGNSTLSASQTYDDNGRLRDLTYPGKGSVAGPLTVRHKYNPDGRLDAVVDPADENRAWWKVTARDLSGKPVEERFGGGATTFRTYGSNTGRLTGIETRDYANAARQQYAYTYNAEGDLNRRSDAARAIHEGFRYDGLGRLYSWHQSDAQGQRVVSGWQVRYFSNLSGDIERREVRQDGSPIEAVVNTFGAKRQIANNSLWPIASEPQFGFDDVGNVIRHPAMGQLTYTPFNLPRTIDGATDIAYYYDASGARVQKTFDPGRQEGTRYFGDIYEQRRVGADIIHVMSLRGEGGVVGQVTFNEVSSTTETSYVFVDHVGSTQVVETYTSALGSTGHAGAATYEERRDDPYGHRVALSGSNIDPRIAVAPQSAPGSRAVTRGFTGHETEADLGVINMKGRIYDPRLARFLQVDPLVSAPYTAQGWNRFSYALGNPLKYVDPSGFDMTLPESLCALYNECFFLPPQEPEVDYYNSIRKEHQTFAAEIADIEREMREQAMGDWWAMNMAAVGDAGAQPAEQAKKTLVVYGDPPEAIQDNTKKVMFSGKITDQNRPSFEKHLRRELSEFTGKDLSKDKATVVALKDLKHLQELLKSGSYNSVIFYGHAFNFGKRTHIQAGSGDISPADWAKSLAGAGVRESIVTGCVSVPFAAGVAAEKLGIRSGGLLFDRDDQIRGSDRSVDHFEIMPQAIKWY
jgi:RHS repeat-associated protein